MTVRYDISIDADPLGLDAFAVETAPKGFDPAGIYIGAIVTSDSGKRYQGCRGYNDLVVGESKVYPFNRLDLGSLNEHAPVLWPEIIPAGASEPITAETTGSEHSYSTATSRFTVRDGSWEWLDYDGGWDLRVRRIGDPYRIEIPRQLDFATGQLHRGELGYAEGTIDGETVRGITFLMYTFVDAGSGVKFIESPLVSVMNNGWFIWMAEMEDGALIAGEGRKGKPGTGWSMSFLVKDGVSQLTRFPEVSLKHAPNGPVERFTVDLDEIKVVANTDACSIWPHVVFGTLESTSDPRKIRRSWSNLEWYPANYKELVAGLRSRAITKEAMREARVENERIIIPGFLS